MLRYIVSVSGLFYTEGFEMHTYAMHAEGGGCGGGYDVYEDLRGLWRSITGGGAGPGAGRGAHRRHHGPPPWAREALGGLGGGRGGPFGRQRKARRGDIRTAALLLLAEEPRNGYQIMQEIEQRSEGAWRPSPGSVYPTLQQLEDEGLIRSEELDSHKLFAITDAGRTRLAERGAETPAPWEQMADDLGESVIALGGAAREVMLAFRQLMRAGNESQLAEAKKILATARRELSRILADGGETDTPEQESD